MELAAICKGIRKNIVDVAIRCKKGHVASALSMVEILVVLFYRVMDIRKVGGKVVNRDRFVLSKGHGAMSLYSVLNHRGFIKVDLPNEYHRDNSLFTSFPSEPFLPGLDFASGSLGHGLSVASGMALSMKNDKKKNKVYCIISDGECQEGSTWEAALFAGCHKLDNLVLILDFNKLQAMGSVADILTLSPLKEKWEAFGFSVHLADGHDVKSLLSAFESAKKSSKPSIIIADTVKGKGISFMEDTLCWHYLPLTGNFAKAALEETR